MGIVEDGATFAAATVTDFTSQSVIGALSVAARNVATGPPCAVDVRTIINVSLNKIIPNRKTRHSM